MIWSYHVISCLIHQPGLIRPYFRGGGGKYGDGGVWLIRHNHMSAMKKRPLVWGIGDYTTQLYRDYFISHFKDPS